MADQRDFDEPLTRVNTDSCDVEALGWNESGAWDEIARYYEALLGPGQAT